MPLHEERLLSRRQQLGLTQTEVAAAIGVKSYQQYASWESGEHSPSLKYIEKLAVALHCSTDYLLGLVNTPADVFTATDLDEDDEQLLILKKTKRYREIIDWALGHLPTLEGGNSSRPAIESDEKPRIAGSNEAA